MGFLAACMPRMSSESVLMLNKIIISGLSEDCNSLLPSKLFIGYMLAIDDIQIRTPETSLRLSLICPREEIN